MAAVEHRCDFIRAHLVEILRDGDLPGEESGAPNSQGLRGVDRGDLDDRLTGLGDDKGFALNRLFDEAGEVGFGLMDVEGTRRFLMD